MSTKKIEKKSFNSPDDKQAAGKVKAETVKIGGYNITRSTMEPGAKWSTDMKPIVKTDSCQVQHIGVLISGRVNLRMDDGTEVEYGPSDIASIPPGHDAWVVGNEPAVFLEWSENST
jgi:hypothetical protein